MNSTRKTDNKSVVPEKSAVKIASKCAEVTSTLDKLNKEHSSLLDTNLASVHYIDCMNAYIAKFEKKN